MVYQRGGGAIKLGRRAQSCEQPKQRSKSKGSLKCIALVRSGKDGEKMSFTQYGLRPKLQ